MVWGMALPKSFGEFWPDGFFEMDRKSRQDGWYQRLTDYYKAQTPDEQKRLFDYKGDPGNAAHSYGTFPSYKLTSEPGTGGDGNSPPYGKLEPYEPPHSFDAVKAYKSLGAIIKLNDRILAVNGQFKAIVEQLEPHVHAFYPITIGMPRGQTYPDAYYTLRVGQYFDAFSPADSAPDSARERQSGFWVPAAKKQDLEGLAMRTSVFGDAHLWRDRRFKEDLTCFSDALQAEIAKAGLTLPRQFGQMKDV